ncbi:thermonuclease family protein [Sphingopyxis panaciterrae]|uniref:thermonuclease family protein n=1 Tax=Sphingopyxis panaciterrae TaxID=363841 RepID=UPI001FB89491|nr:thermonuclease family protein [Sphingopyxis panaciterrae]
MLRGPSPLTRLRWRRRLRSLAALLLLGGLAMAAWVWVPAPVTTVPLVHIIDGDSLSVRQGEAALTIRLTGLDAVEYRQDCGRPDGSRWPCGREARTALATLAGRGPLHCELAAKDIYRRTLATCRTHIFPDGIDLGAGMVRAGWAVATTDAYLLEEAEAQAKRRGIWQGQFILPANWRASHERAAAALTSPQRPDE